MINSKLILILIVTCLAILGMSSAYSQSLIFTYSNSTQSIISNNPSQLSNSMADSNTTLPSLPDSCMRSAEIQVNSKASSFDISKGFSLSNNNAEFKSRIQNYNSTFATNFDIWTLNKTSCTLTWKTTNFVYDLQNGTNIVKRIVVTEDPTLFKVLNITEQHFTGRFSTANPVPNWSGYEFAGNGANPPTTPMYNSYSTFTVPTVSVPAYPSNACSGGSVCALATWVGLEDEAGAFHDKKLAQTGFAGNITCTGSNCSTKYSIWYEFYPALPVYCTGLGQVNAGHSITADIYNDTIVGGTHTNRIDVLTVDNTNTNANVCSTHQDSFFTITPKYSSFITEGPTWATLPQFNSVQMTQNTVYYGNSYRYISEANSNGWFNEYNFFNSTETSITNHDPIGQNFTETWNTNCSPTTGDWTVQGTCTLSSNFGASGNVIVPNGVVLRVPSTRSLTIDFSNHNLQINSWGGVLIDGSGGPVNTSIPGGSIKCPTC